MAGASRLLSSMNDHSCQRGSLGATCGAYIPVSGQGGRPPGQPASQPASQEAGPSTSLPSHVVIVAI